MDLTQRFISFKVECLIPFLVPLFRLKSWKFPVSIFFVRSQVFIKGWARWPDLKILISSQMAHGVTKICAVKTTKDLSSECLTLAAKFGYTCEFSAGGVGVTFHLKATTQKTKATTRSRKPLSSVAAKRQARKKFTLTF